jgi:hypothetical protein
MIGTGTKIQTSSASKSSTACTTSACRVWGLLPPQDLNLATPSGPDFLSSFAVCTELGNVQCPIGSAVYAVPRSLRRGGRIIELIRLQQQQQLQLAAHHLSPAASLSNPSAITPCQYSASRGKNSIMSNVYDGFGSAVPDMSAPQQVRPLFLHAAIVFICFFVPVVFLPPSSFKGELAAAFFATDSCAGWREPT